MEDLSFDDIVTDTPHNIIVIHGGCVWGGYGAHIQGGHIQSASTVEPELRRLFKRGGEKVVVSNTRSQPLPQVNDDDYTNALLIDRGMIY
jgi:hypothetical protein